MGEWRKVLNRFFFIFSTFLICGIIHNPCLR
jgi:hypothetical protein